MKGLDDIVKANIEKHNNKESIRRRKSYRRDVLKMYSELIRGVIRESKDGGCSTFYYLPACIDNVYTITLISALRLFKIKNPGFDIECNIPAYGRGIRKQDSKCPSLNSYAKITLE